MKTDDTSPLRADFCESRSRSGEGSGGADERPMLAYSGSTLEIMVLLSISMHESSSIC